MSTINNNDTTKNSTAARGQRTRPAVDCDKATQLVESLYGFTVVSIEQLGSYADRNFHVRVAAAHANAHVREIRRHGYVLKVMNSNDSLKPAHVGEYKKLSYRRGTARCVVSVEILPIATQQYSTTSPEQIEVMKLELEG